ncbi:AraC family transcriptional regulator [Phyllobacterium zundukense]|uniref:AraC family transcriptional regulator n=1 Tax=Phyllobacterium zundukense TaxID=1867719 RepID=A0ACD4CWE1_9HYPH|nr:AraC family transcriptional regulator [Phyllobacterium zundukense]UXN57883.1 AraC family transcriptional regulator [Phyllobacterium zundukense]
MSQNTSSDALSGLAPLLRVRPELQYVCHFGAQWASPHPPERDAWAPFHIVTDGACVMHLTTAGRSIQLRTGDVALLPRGSAHVMHGVTTSPAASGPFGIKGRENGAILVKSNTEGETTAQLVCGRLKFDHAGQNLILSALPEAVVVAAAEREDAFHIRRIIALVKEELDAARPGAAAIASDLASALLVMVVRAHIEAERASDSLLALLGHPQAGRAVVAMLEAPGRAWTLDELASVAQSSRATLVRIFRKSAKVAPLAFFSEVRLELARRKLAGSDRPLADIAAEVGYLSESAFSRAFQLRYGKRPGEARHGLERKSLA